MADTIYLDVPFWEIDDAKATGAQWDSAAKKWYIPAKVPDPSLFEPWIPGFSRVRTAAPETFPAKLAAYYMRVLEHQDIDDMGNQKPILDGITFQDLDGGRVTGHAGPRAEFWSEARKLHEKSPFPLSPFMASKDAQGVEPPPLAGIVVIFGWRFRRSRQVLLALPALMAEDGTLLAAEYRLPIINPAYFEPQEKKRLPLLGSRADLDERIIELDWTNPQPWQDAWQAINALFQSLNKEKSTLQDFRPETTKPPSIWLVPHEHQDESVTHLKALYHQLSYDKTSAPKLYRTTCEGTDAAALLSIEQQRKLALRHTGHMSSAFGLDPSQREALKHFLATPEGNALAVSGPPGTGKTACLQGIIATTLVNATLAAEEASPRPPIMVACSATNQAVTNIINSFGDIADPGEATTLSSRWLPPIQSYGWYFASQTAASQAASQKFQILRRDRRETWVYFGSADGFAEYGKSYEAQAALQGMFLRAFRENFPNEATLTLEAAADALLMRLRSFAKAPKTTDSGNRPAALPSAVEAASELSELVHAAGLRRCQTAQHRLKKKDRRDGRLSARHAALEAELAELSRETRGIQNAARFIRDVIAHKPRSNWISRFFHWLRLRRARQRRRVLLQMLEPFIGISNELAGDAALLGAADEVIGDLQAEHADAAERLERFELRRSCIADAEQQWLAGAQSDCENLEEMLALLSYFRSIVERFLPPDMAVSWQNGLEAGMCGEYVEADFDAQQGARLGAALAAGGEDAAAATFSALDELLDRSIRRHCFDLTARYWEARWLIDTSSATIHSESLEEGLRRHCMLAPVVVSTVNLLPSLFRTAVNSADMDLGLADLLIIDEAGQVDPAISVGLFALAKRAIVVGDVEQLKPIWKVGQPQDLGLVRQSHLQEEAKLLDQRGLRASSGSAMATAQGASAFSAEDGRGITLLRHYRCRPTIIEFCNRLVYDRLRPLIPVTKEDPGRMFHPMSYVECADGPASRENGSVVNRAEADELIDWLIENRRRIEDYYDKNGSLATTAADVGYRDIGDLVGIVTPFAEHTRYLRNKLRDRLEASGEAEASSIVNRMKLGTVHTLQGAERPLVLFSATNTPNDGGMPFIDSNRDMLNVAVSRAQDHFVLFGHSGLFFSPKALDTSNHLPSATLGRYMKTHGQRLYPRRLVIVESPGKATALQASLGKDCRVLATSGHFREIEKLDPNTARVKWRVDPEREPMLSEIAGLLEDVDELVLATDDDREGDAIAWHLIESLRERCPLDGVAISRMMFCEITDDAVLAAFNDRVTWTNTKRAEAAVTRAIVDKAIGQIMSAEVNTRLQRDGAPHRYGVGRIRAALLRLIADNDEKIRNAPKQEYFVRLEAEREGETATFFLTKSDTLDAPSTRFASREEAEATAQQIRTSNDLNLRLEKKGYWLGPATPAGTAEVLIAAYEECGLLPQDTYRILQDLYEGNERAT